MMLRRPFTEEMAEIAAPARALGVTASGRGAIGPREALPSAEEIAPVRPHARLESMFGAHYAFVWRSLRRIGVPTDSVDDAAQEVFVIAARKIAGIREGAERAFLFGTALRVASDARRARVRRPESSGDPLAIDRAEDPTPALDELTDQKKAREMLDAALRSMPLDLRAVFVLFEIEGLTMTEIADCADIPHGTVASRLRRARDWFESYVTRWDARSVRSMRSARDHE